MVVNDIEVERTGSVGNLSHATKAVFDGMQVLKELFRRNARAHKHHGVDEGVLVFVIRGLAFVKARYVYDLRIGNRAQARDGLLEIGYLAFRLFARIRDKRDIRTECDQSIRPQVGERFHRLLDIMDAHHRCAQLTRHKGFGGRGGIALAGISDSVRLSDITLARYGAHGGIP